jgi:lipopolysaccharide export system protein LptA
MKLLPLAFLLLTLPASGLLAQTISGADTGTGLLTDASPTPAPSSPKKTGTDAAPAGPTIIESQAMDYDEKTRLAIFTGDDYGVYVKDPSFVVYCDKLTAHMRKSGGTAAPGTPGAPKATSPAPAPGSKAAAATQKANGLQRAVCEGALYRPVVIVQDKPASGTEQAVHNVGIAAKADYNADTGDIILTGWPRVSQGINTQIATSERTVMIMNKDGHTMKTTGPSRTVIQEQDQPKTSSPSTTPQ